MTEVRCGDQRTTASGGEGGWWRSVDAYSLKTASGGDLPAAQRPALCANTLRLVATGQTSRLNSKEIICRK